MTSILLSVEDVRRGSDWGSYRNRSILKIPFPLAFQRAPTGPRGGTKQRLYSLEDPLVRCRPKPSFTAVKDAALLILAKQKFHET